MNTHKSDSVILTNTSLIDFFRSKVIVTNSGYPSTYERALKSFASYINSTDVDFIADPNMVTADWIIHLYVCGLSLKTAIPYLNAIASLYNKGVKEGILPSTNAFRSIKTELEKGGEVIWNRGLHETDFIRFQNFTRSSASLGKKTSPARGIILFSLLNGAMPLSETAIVARNDLDCYSQASQDVALAFTESRRKYVFPLSQSKLTHRQLAAETARLTAVALARGEIRMLGSTDDTLKGYWAFGAIRNGIPAHCVRAFFSQLPSAMPLLNICPIRDLSADAHKAVTMSVGAMFVNNLRKWFVMRLRPFVKFDDLKKRFEALRDTMAIPEVFYPSEEIIRRVGKKRLFENRPVIPDIVFFRCRETDIYPLFMEIGDIAWCYRLYGRNGGPYAAIPKRSFELFQETIGQFTPDYEVARAGELPLQMNDRVVVINGMFQGTDAEIIKINKDSKNDSIVYRLLFFDNNGIEWKIDMDSRMVRRQKN